MNDSAALLPIGLRDTLPPAAEHEAWVTERLMAAFRQNGYRQVSPPFVEFEDTLLAGPGAAMRDRTFRLVDPASQRTLAIRADITPQIARIGGTRLSQWPRPLRLSYTGTVLRVMSDQLRPDRQFRQAGIELIGSPSVAADAEAIVVPVEALTALGVEGLSVDLSLPSLAVAAAPSLGGGDGKASALREALNQKDRASICRLAPEEADILVALLQAGGPADAAMAALAALDLPAAARQALAPVEELLPLVRAALPDLVLTFDPVEHRGFEYHQGVGFSLFARGLNGELGRGGRYTASYGSHDGETATGATIYMDVLMRALAEPAPAHRLYLPLGVRPSARRQRQAEGWLTVAGLEPVADAREAAADARRLGCSHWLNNGTVEPL